MNSDCNHTLNFGTTDHIKPHPFQEGKFDNLAGAGIQADTFETTGFLDWIDGDTKGNLEKMFNLSYNNAHELIPALDDYRFDLETNEFRSKSDNSVFGEERIRRFASMERGTSGGRTFSPGRTTIKRALLTKSFSEKQGLSPEEFHSKLAVNADEPLQQ